MREALQRAELPKRHCQPGNVKEQQQTAFDKIKAKLGKGQILALIGTRGSGKTWMGCEAIRESINVLSRSARYCKAMEFFMEVKSTYKDNATLTEKDVINEFAKVSLLVIDEISERSESEWENRLLVHLIDKRYDYEKDTILIGNFTRENFIKSVGSSIASRMSECGSIVECNWDSLR